MAVLIALAILLPIILFGWCRVESTHQIASGDLRADARDERAEALRSPHVWSIALPFALALAAQVGFIVHQLAFLQPHLGHRRRGQCGGCDRLAAAVVGWRWHR